MPTFMILNVYSRPLICFNINLYALENRHQGNINNMVRWLQEYLDEQFYQLEELQDDSSPNFVEEVVTLFFRDSARLLSNIELAL